MKTTVKYIIQSVNYGRDTGGTVEIGDYPDSIRFRAVENGTGFAKNQAVRDELARRVELVRVLGLSLEADRIASLTES